MTATPFRDAAAAWRQQDDDTGSRTASYQETLVSAIGKPSMRSSLNMNRLSWQPTISNGRHRRRNQRHHGMVRKWDSYLAVCLKATADWPVVALNREQGDDRTFNLGYIFHLDYRGQGYATEGPGRSRAMRSIDCRHHRVVTARRPPTALPAACWSARFQENLREHSIVQDRTRWQADSVRRLHLRTVKR